MPVNRVKLAQILLEECEGIEERCSGYGKNIKTLLAEIIELERANESSRTNIQQQISDKLEAEAMHLNQTRTDS